MVHFICWMVVLLYLSPIARLFRRNMVACGNCRSVDPCWMVRSGVFGGDYLEDGSLLWHRREHNLGSEPVAGTYRGTPCTCGGHMVLVSGHSIYTLGLVPVYIPVPLYLPVTLPHSSKKVEGLAQSVGHKTSKSWIKEEKTCCCMQEACCRGGWAVGHCAGAVVTLLFCCGF